MVFPLILRLSSLDVSAFPSSISKALSSVIVILVYPTGISWFLTWCFFIHFDTFHLQMMNRHNPNMMGSEARNITWPWNNLTWESIDWVIRQSSSRSDENGWERAREKSKKDCNYSGQLKLKAAMIRIDWMWVSKMRR
jgi:hypothetical protein